jgi:hypothetical protein
MIKTAFVYEWKNNQNGMKYLGSHFGYLNDGYISSSNHFNSFYNKNPNNFVRTIIYQGKNRIDALGKESELLHEVNASKNLDYYNLHNNPGKGWSHHDDPKLSKIYYDRISKSKLGKPSHNKGTAIKESQKIKLCDVWKVSGPNIEGEIEIVNMSEFCKKNNLNPSAMSAVARGKVKQHLGYICEKITNNRNVVYDPIEWKSKGKPGGVNFGKSNGFSKKVKIQEIVYDCMKEASEKTGLSLYLIRKNGEFNV